VVLVVKNFAAVKGVCHIGLGVTATNTMRVLRRAGIHVEAWPAQTYAELRSLLSAAKSKSDYTPITHVVVSSPAWVQPAEFQTLCLLYPEIHFVLLSHSGTAYLSIDKYGIRNIREVAGRTLSLHNLSLAANNPRSQKTFDEMLGCKSVLLPNLYDTETFVPYSYKPVGNTLKICNPGAGRPWKNQLTAAEAGVMLARRLGVQLEYYVNSKRPDGGERMIESRAELFDSMPGCKLIEIPWAQWPKFRAIMGTMNIVFQPSFDETFDVCVADGIAEGVPSVTSPSIEWSPRSWWCEPCDPSSLVEVALNLLHNQRAVEDGRNALKSFVKSGTENWMEFIHTRA
jgi:glycosyltransferase involved in cell wall biosynthesis